MKCALASALLCLPALALNPDRHISQYSHSVWRIQDGFFNGAPSALAQTKDGYLWIGTQAGLVRFDGARFLPFQPPADKPLRSPIITSLLAGSDGSLWIGTSALLAHWKSGDLINYANRLGLVGAIRQDSSGVVWISRQRTPDASGALCRVEGTELRCFGKDAGIPFRVAGPMITGIAGDLWLASGNQLVQWKVGSSTIYPLPGVKSNEDLGSFSALAIGPDNSLWAGLEHSGPGLGLQHLVRGVWGPLAAGGTDSSGFAVSTLLFDRDHALWIGTTSQGVYRVCRGDIDHFGASDGLSSDSVNNLFEDHEGDVWVTTSKGLDKFRDLHVVTFSKGEGLSADRVSSVLATVDGGVWAGNKEALNFILGRKVSAIDQSNGLPGRQITSLLEDQRGRLWVGIEDKLYRFFQGQFRQVTQSGGGSTGTVISLAEDPDGTIWAASAGEPSKLLHVSDLKVTEEVLAPSRRRITALATNPEGGLWIGFVDGDLAGFSKFQWRPIPFHRPANTGVVSRVVLGPAGSVLASTSAGVIGWRDNKPRTLSNANGLPCNRTYSLIFDSQQTLWLYTPCGLLSIADGELQRWWQDPNAKIAVRTFDILDGAQPASTSFQPSAAMSPDGRLWFANSNVLQVIDPLRLSKNPVPPPVHIETVTADLKEYPIQRELRLPALTRELQIDYTALSFVVPQRVRFRYKLEGWENEWRDAGTRRQAFYTNLRPSSYRFHVMASNDDGLWNETGAVLDFSIAPAYYQTTWFLIFCAIALAGTLWLLYLLRLKRVTEEIQQRMGARLEERERIARELHDTLLQGFQGLMLRFQSVMKILPSSEPPYQMMTKVMDRADEVLLEGRQRVRDLREEGKSGTELPEVLARCGQELAQDRTALFNLVVMGTPRAVSPIVFTDVYRIAREALFNAFQHSQATKIEVELTYTDIQVCLRVRDDGAGIDSQTLNEGKTGHWGLSGMRERAQRIGAQLSIWSNPGAGTEVELTVPARVAYPGNRKDPIWLRIIRACRASGRARDRG